MQRKMFYLLFTAILGAVAIANSCKDGGGGNPIDPSLPMDTTIIGKLVYTANPCDTEPCLPGVVAAVMTSSINYIITINGSWCWEEVIIGSDTLKLNDSLRIFGTVSKHIDLLNSVYYEIKVINYEKFSGGKNE